MRGAELGRIQQPFVERNDGVDAFDDEGVERPFHAGNGFIAVRGVDDQFGHQRVVVGRNDAVGISGGVDAHADAAGDVPASDAPRRRGKGLRMLGVDAALDGVAAHGDGVGEDVGQAGAGGDQNLTLHQVDATHHFGHRMLHLNARIYLNEIEVLVLVHQEFDGAGVGVTNGR